ncbi:hypothetical protein Pint_30952 [Pistacia integerrima]|uniref:Uncharacterized protein n=1 Tax=Pistacia integerrima TaxID=434235 RepID=A0ACC0XQ02_9ROSI|nr:hypothetical protein Pint_30952 [Pistacia integerrima]
MGEVLIGHDFAWMRKTLHARRRRCDQLESFKPHVYLSAACYFQYALCLIVSF